MKNTLFALILFFLAVAVILFLDLFGFQGKYDETAFAHPTTLQIQDGVVAVNNRNAQDGQELKEGDVLITNADTEASVIFFDDSISRLKPGTTLRIVALDDEAYFDGGGEIALEVQNGEVWSKVQKQTGEDFHFEVGTRQINATVRGSALNVAFDGETTQIQAAEHSVLITAFDEAGSIVEEVPLIEGEQVLVGDDFFEESEEEQEGDETDRLKTLKEIVVPISEEEKKEIWFAGNEKKDERYIVGVERKRKEHIEQNIGALPGTIGYQAKRLKDAIDLRLASDDEKAELQLRIAERSLAEARLLADAGEAQNGADQARKATQLIEEVSQSSSDERVQRAVKQAIQRGKIGVRNALPADDAYVLKEALRTVELSTANESQKEKIQAKQLQRKVLDVYDLQKKSPQEKRIEEFKRSLRQELKSSPQVVEEVYLEASEDLSPVEILHPVVEKEEVLEDELPVGEEFLDEREETIVIPDETVAEEIVPVKKEREKPSLPSGIQINTNVKKSE